MPNSPHPTSLEQQIDQWRSYLRRRETSHSVDVATQERNLREQLASLVAAGLETDEAFLVAVKRMGNLDSLSRQFAREHSDRLWKQLVLAPTDSGESPPLARKDAIVAFALAVAAAVLFKLPVLFGFDLERHGSFYARNVGLFVLPLLTGYFAWKRQLGARSVCWLASGFVAGGIFANVYPFARFGQTEALSAVHLPIALGLLVGIAYVGGHWNQVAGRMDFIRFAGELLIYFSLIALGGGVFTAFVGIIFKAIGVDIGTFIGWWLLPCGAAGAVLIASWLVEAKQSVIENVAPILTRLFTPLFAAALVTFLGTVAWTGRSVGIERQVLIAFDLLLVVVIGLLVYSVSARNPSSPPGGFDVLLVVLLVGALLTDAVMLWTTATRITELGFTPNRVAALGENVILLVNLAWSAVLYIRFLRGRVESFASLEKWQTDYLPVYGAWAALVVILFPPLFGFI